MRRKSDLQQQQGDSSPAAAGSLVYTMMHQLVGRETGVHTEATTVERSLGSVDSKVGGRTMNRTCSRRSSITLTEAAVGQLPEPDGPASVTARFAELRKSRSRRASALAFDAELAGAEAGS